ncbi:hypothetical protein HK103_006000 [Boothiomyces macroporosus]|uniref:PH domain-containing protein n=1 Tax=Boothiomyces macroporosus TaxID=261099 RepID=A0AAD5ULE8_9FUNG|nr:hypothetical protein HK103_006000 [Boothiomyces macroporosus]KAJ3315119.1 hypothetical protein HDV04_004260 [Boothiomyces sp. JEL0838]
MAFEIFDLPSGGVVFKGKLTQKKLTAKSKRQVMLCLPYSIEDIQAIHHLLGTANANVSTLPEDQLEALKEKDMEVFGHIALSAISGFPLLVVGTNARTFIHFSQIQGLYDEQDLKSACCFSLLTAQSEYRFFSETSMDYQKWVGALTRAFENMNTSTSAYRAMSPELSSLPRPVSQLSRDPEDYIEAHRVLSMNRSSSRNSVNSRRKSLIERGASDVGPQTNRRNSLFSKMKALFLGKEEPQPEETRGRNEESFVSKLRKRSKSVSKFISTLGRSKD